MLSTRCGGDSWIQGMIAYTTCAHISCKRSRTLCMQAVHLSQALCTNRELQLLNLEANDVRDDGGAALARTLASNQILTSLDLSSANLTSVGATALAEALKKNNSLKVRERERE